MGTFQPRAFLLFQILKKCITNFYFICQPRIMITCAVFTQPFILRLYHLLISLIKPLSTFFWYISLIRIFLKWELSFLYIDSQNFVLGYTLVSIVLVMGSSRCNITQVKIKTIIITNIEKYTSPYCSNTRFICFIGSHGLETEGIYQWRYMAVHFIMLQI